jgi:hypothetical protein
MSINSGDGSGRTGKRSGVLCLWGMAHSGSPENERGINKGDNPQAPLRVVNSLDRRVAIYVRNPTVQLAAFYDVCGAV